MPLTTKPSRKPKLTYSYLAYILLHILHNKQLIASLTFSLKIKFPPNIPMYLNSKIHGCPLVERTFFLNSFIC